MKASIKLYEDMVQNLTILCKKLQIKSGDRINVLAKRILTKIAQDRKTQYNT